jgi:hypothetical protein
MGEILDTVIAMNAVVGLILRFQELGIKVDLDSLPDEVKKAEAERERLNQELNS